MTAFEGNARFSVRRLLGSGGMGAVYEAHDAETGQAVALKTILHTEPSALYRLKNEFRSLADIAHPNLVSLFELFIEENSCFFTMELVDGVDFVTYVTERPAQESRSGDTETLTLLYSTPIASTPSDPRSGSDSKGFLRVSPADPERLVPALVQLVEGLAALHEGGKLHRDIKPSNVLVNRAGRVVILDFGLATEMTPLGGLTREFVGTPAYSSPEQTKASPLSAASDWYGVGVTLYRALTGRVPFDGSYAEIVTKKQNSDPLPPSMLVQNVDPDLEALCMALLRRDPRERPSAREILAALATRNASAAEAPRDQRHASFVGREKVLSTLREAFRRVQQGTTVQAFVHGSSGMGKTTLVRKFLRQLGEEERVLAVSGRCYESESIPYKALDGVVDSLTRHLVSLPLAQAQAMLPRDVAAMAKMFPMLARLEALSGYRSPVREIADPLTLRQRGLTALRELLARIGDRSPLLMFIDDLHWSDPESIALLENLLRPPDAPVLLLITTFRSEQVSKHGFLQSLLEQANGKEFVEVRLEALTAEETGRLTSQLLGTDMPAGREFVEAVTQEAQGNPFLVEQFARWAMSAGGGRVGSITVGEMIEANMHRLPEEARVLLETLAIAARPLPARVAFRASGIQENGPSLVSALRSANFLRSSAAQPLELYHDRLREGIAARLEPGAVQAIHSNLAESLVATGFDDPEVLFEHHHEAGQFEPAARYALLSAEKASAALAFDRAATFYRRALELVPHTPAEMTRLKSEMGQALANAGRTEMAANAYLEAAEGADFTTALDLERRAAEQLLVGGHVDRGLEVLRKVLARVGLWFPRWRKSVLLSVILRRIQLRIRSLRFTERPVTEIPPRQLLHLDICWATAVGLSMVDQARGQDFHTRHLLLALKAGEPYRLACGLAMEGPFSAATGERGQRRAVRFLEMADKLSARVGNPHAIGSAMLMAGITKSLGGQWRQAAELCGGALEILRDRCTGVLWEVTSAQLFMLTAMLNLGEFHKVSSRLPALMAAASEHGNLYATTEFRTRFNFLWLVADDPESARRELAEALQLWSHHGFHRQHLNALRSKINTALYTGDAEAAWGHVISERDALRGSLLLRIQVFRIQALNMRARIALAITEQEPARAPRLLKETLRLARAIESERKAWADPLAWLLQAGVAACEGNAGLAETLLSKTVVGFEQGGMMFDAAIARRRLGQVRRTGEGAGGLEEMGVKNPGSMLRAFAPGFRMFE